MAIINCTQKKKHTKIFKKKTNYFFFWMCCWITQFHYLISFFFDKRREYLKISIIYFWGRWLFWREGEALWGLSVFPKLQKTFSPCGRRKIYQNHWGEGHFLPKTRKSTVTIEMIFCLQQPPPKDNPLWRSRRKPVKVLDGREAPGKFSLL